MGRNGDNSRAPTHGAGQEAFPALQSATKGGGIRGTVEWARPNFAVGVTGAYLLVGSSLSHLPKLTAYLMIVKWWLSFQLLGSGFSNFFSGFPLPKISSNASFKGANSGVSGEGTFDTLRLLLSFDFTLQTPSGVKVSYQMIV